MQNIYCATVKIHAHSIQSMDYMLSYKWEQIFPVSPVENIYCTIADNTYSIYSIDYILSYMWEQIFLVFQVQNTYYSSWEYILTVFRIQNIYYLTVALQVKTDIPPFFRSRLYIA